MRSTDTPAPHGEPPRPEAELYARMERVAEVDPAFFSDVFNMGYREAERRYRALLAVPLPSSGEPDRCGRCWVCLDGETDEVTGWPVTSQMMILCPTCGNKRCPHATNHRHACTGSNEPGQPGSVYAAPLPSAGEPEACPKCQGRGSYNEPGVGGIICDCRDLWTNMGAGLSHLPSAPSPPEGRSEPQGFVEEMDDRAVAWEVVIRRADGVVHNRWITEDAASIQAHRRIGTTMFGTPFEITPLGPLAPPEGRSEPEPSHERWCDYRPERGELYDCNCGYSERRSKYEQSLATLPASPEATELAARLRRIADDAERERSDALDDLDIHDLRAAARLLEAGAAAPKRHYSS